MSEEDPQKRDEGVVVRNEGEFENEIVDVERKEPQSKNEGDEEKSRLEESATISLPKEVSAIIQNKLPQKLGDPGSYAIPVKIGYLEAMDALCDLGVSVSLMPYSIAKSLKVGDLKPTRMSLQLADRTVRLPLGILEDVPVKVGRVFVPCDFVVMEME
ncbi:uncharacterized protein LOC110702365 [Chenopodium quinoa]|uniref:uncharacterized protein LOC110702365 n=1 Tax=Chenopodium quinoa TaxID=63459 RepID=UPI000B772787|nr:uncharacterized protein LOC110702365 [Chenopodium quinoa]